MDGTNISACSKWRYLQRGGYKPTVREYFDNIWIPSLEGRLAPTTLHGYRTNTRLYIAPDPFGSMPLSRLTSQKIRAWLQTLDTRSKFDYAWRVFRAGINCAVDEFDLLTINPLPHRVKHPPKSMELPNVLVSDEATEVIKAVRGSAVEPVVLCSLCLGLRREESTALFWEDIGRDGLVNIEKTLVEVKGKVIEGGTKTAKSTRKVYLPPSAHKRLEELRKDGHNIPLMADARGARMAPDKVSKTFKDIIKKAGTKYVTLSKLRNSFASIAIATGANPVLVDQYMGHSVSKVAGQVLYEHYLIHDAEQTREVSFVFEQAVFKTLPTSAHIVNFPKRA
jgi:integrase